MTTHPFEDPAKTELRGRAEVAIDAAAYELVNPTPIDLPSDSQLAGKLLGDLQSLDGEQQKYVYYLRTQGEKAIPKWLANLAMVAHQIPNCRVYVIVPSTSAILEKSCQSSGAGLLMLTDDNRFELLLDFDEPNADESQIAFGVEVTRTRRLMESKLNLNTDSLSKNFSQVNDLTTGMNSKKRDDYVANITSAHQTWIEWGDSVSAKLDEAQALGDLNLLNDAKRMIDEGANLGEDDHEVS